MLAGDAAAALPANHVHLDPTDQLEIAGNE